MADQKELQQLFGGSGHLDAEVLNELASISRIHALDAQELSYKWESYAMRIAGDTTQVDLESVRAFKKDLQEQLERESRAKQHARGSTSRTNKFATPRTTSASKHGGRADDLLGMVDGSHSSPSMKRSFQGTKRPMPETPTAIKSSRLDMQSSPLDPQPDAR